jgi:hypothetical protein
MKILSAIAGLAGIVAIVFIATRFKKAAAQTGLSNCPTLRNFINTVEEAAGFSIPATEGAGGGGFSGWRANITGYPDQPNVIAGTGATKISNNPVLEWIGSGPSKQVPIEHPAIGSMGFICPPNADCQSPLFGVRKAVVY